MNKIRNARMSGVLACALLALGPALVAQKRLPIGGSTVPPLDGQTPALPSAADSGLGGRNGGSTSGLSPDDFSLGDSSVRRNLDALRVNMANTERQRILTRDATQLLHMAAELRMKIATNAPGMTPEEITRQVDTIEKLARNVKDRMKGAR